MNYTQLLRDLQSPDLVSSWAKLYGHREGALVNQSRRYNTLIKLHKDIFRSEGELYIISSPGRCEVIGNHTDHNRGKVLTAAVNLDILAVVTARKDLQVNLHSEGYQPINIDLTNLEAKSEETGSTAALIRGMAEGMCQKGFMAGGFDAVVTSDILAGSGLSSSAAFEVMVGCIFDTLFNHHTLDAVKRAQIAQFAENVYFGKPSGLMDQLASSLGGMIAIDFKTEEPKIEPLHFSFEAAGYAITVVNTGGSHHDLTGNYADIKQEMMYIANYFDADTLRALRPELLSQNIAALRKQFGDRAVLRAMHYYAENERVSLAVEALQCYDLDTFFKQINMSGKSSWQLLQNISASERDQPLALALTMAEVILSGQGASRVHGGGFAGTTLNFVPINILERFITDMELVFGTGSCNILDVRQEGATAVFAH